MDNTSSSSALGKIFLSYSHPDAAFVRRLNSMLQSNGYDTWLDEKDLVAGDAIVERVAEATKNAKVVIVVVSATSVEKPWLPYELAEATARMIAGGCRVIPILIGDIEPPDMVNHLLYLDFRGGKRGGRKKLLDALHYESSRYPIVAPPSMASPDAIERSRAIEAILSDEFDGSGWASADFSAVRSANWEIYYVNAPNGEIEIAYEQILDYGNRHEPLTRLDWNDFQQLVSERRLRPPGGASRYYISRRGR